jgi:hypothetical protein
MRTTYTLSVAEYLSDQHNEEFVVAQECREIYKDEDGNEKIRTRKYLIFKDAEEYFNNIDLYPNCHEMIIKRYGFIRGRLVFDFDIKNKNIPETFKTDIEEAIISTFNKNYNNINTGIFMFVWLTSLNKEKFSKHLIVRNCYFEDWLQQIKYFYQHFQNEIKINDKFNWIDSSELIDYQLARNHSSLRLPLNSKIDGNKLLFDENFSFYDGLIYPAPHQRKNEQRILLINQKTILKQKEYKLVEIEDHTANKAIFWFKKYIDTNNSFSVIKRENQYIYLKRNKPSKCPISGKLHDNENACLILDNDKTRFYCYRGCKNTTTNNNNIIINKKNKSNIKQILKNSNLPLKEKLKTEKLLKRKGLFQL